MRKLVIAATMTIASLGSTIAAGQNPNFAANGPFLLFFDWGKPDISGDARTVLDQVATAYRQSPGTQLRIAGHTDRSGSTSYNRLASRRRGEAVRAELARRGVPPSATTVVAYGEDNPIVPTEDGVREVQNRRVEISVVTDQ